MECDSKLLLNHKKLWLEKKPNDFLFFTKSKIKFNNLTRKAFLKNLRTVNKQCEPPVQPIPAPLPATTTQNTKLVRGRPHGEERDNKKIKM